MNSTDEDLVKALRASLKANEQLKREKELCAALARACAEFAAEKAATKEDLDDERLSLQLRVDHLEKQLRGKKNVRLLHSR